ncbi:MAG TPA: glycosyltransferase family 2 protein [Thermoanaerobaculaceae bacterium]|nr:glycosyltransferase family 2 protein [Thermoanaerobaculaceae bacterium]
MSETALQLDLSIIFVLAVILIWFMIAYQLVLTVAGFFHVVRSAREKRRVDAMTFDFPRVAVLIPAHNEASVIRQTLEAMLAFDYPADRYEVLVVNDGSSDETGAIVAEFAARDPRIRLIDVAPGEGGKGKSRALNIGLSHTDAAFIAVYDADNTPEPPALRYLVSQLLLHPELGAVLGKFRTVNKNRNLLTRFINVETLSFQSIVQAGRWALFHISTLPGTNFVIRRELIDTLGGWDENAITEDSEMSIRVYMEGYRIKVIPYAVTHEQEPETWKVWFKQRTRWVRGNNYVATKFVRQIPRFKSKRLAVEVLYLASLYYVFFVAIVVSDLLFLLAVAGLVAIPLPGPYTAVWVLAFLLFIMEILLALSYDREDSLAKIGLIVLAYFTYCQLWIVVVARALWLDFVKREKQTWVKTVRFQTPAAK